MDMGWSLKWSWSRFWYQTSDVKRKGSNATCITGEEGEGMCGTEGKELGKNRPFGTVHPKAFREKIVLIGKKGKFSKK